MSSFTQTVLRNAYGDSLITAIIDEVNPSDNWYLSVENNTKGEVKNYVDGLEIEISYDNKEDKYTVTKNT